METYTHGTPRVDISDSTVIVSGGVVRLGNTLMKYQGGQIDFSSMIDFGTDSSKYQYSLLYLSPIDQAVDMTTTVSDPVSTIRELEYPTLPSDSTDIYSNTHPLGLFTFYSSDGTSAELKSHITV